MVGRSLAYNNPHRRMRVWVWLAAVVAILAVVKWTSIQTGPSANEAMVAIRVAQDELAQAQRIHRAAQSPTLNDAQAALRLAFFAA